MRRNDEKGIAHVAAILVVLIVVAIGLVGWYVFTKNSDSSNKASGGSDYVEWSFNGSTWQPSGKAPACPEPNTIRSPIDVTAVNAVLYPGQFRGGNYKAHGGLGIDGATSNQYDVKALRDAYLYRGARYIEDGSVQYMFDFLDPCGVLYRYDHLATLTPEFQAYADQLPPAQPNDSRTQTFNEHPFIKEGTLVATAIGYSTPKVNAFFDVGVYDLRQPNSASEDPAFTSNQAKTQSKELSFFSVCWFDWLEGSEKETIQNLPPRNSAENTSDYCVVN